MLFSSNIFLFVFLPLVLLFYYTLFKKCRPLQNTFLFLASLFFYAWGEPRFVLIMLLSIAVNWLFGLLIGLNGSRSKFARTFLILDIIFNLVIIFIYKYLMFVMTNIKLLFHMDGLEIPEIALPIGISFFTFQAMSYVIDVYRGDGEAQKNPINVGLYIALFPQLIAGPIVRYQTVAEEIHTRKETFDDFCDGVVRFIIGLGKKILLANNMAIVADFAFETSGSNSVLLAWLGVTAYGFQILFDFSGYSDMAIGLGQMFGFHFLENFDYPYISLSITEFWRRWHMSLGSWFRDYVYIPLGGNRSKTAARRVFNIFVVWFLTGVWHGANWTFILWGLMYFVLIAFEKYSSFDVRDQYKKHHFIKHVYTLFFTWIGWVLFRSDSLSDVIKYLGNMFGYHTALIDDGFLAYFRQYAVYIVICIIASTPILKKIQKKSEGNRLISALAVIALCGIFVASVSFIVKNTYNPFIYFNF